MDTITASERTTADTVYDVVTVLALLLGGLVVPVVGWVAGVVLLWNGPRWTVAERWIGTLAWPVVVTLALATVLVWPGRVTFLLAVAVGSLVLLVLHVALSRVGRTR